LVPNGRVSAVIRSKKQFSCNDFPQTFPIKKRFSFPAMTMNLNLQNYFSKIPANDFILSIRPASLDSKNMSPIIKKSESNYFG